MRQALGTRVLRPARVTLVRVCSRTVFLCCAAIGTLRQGSGSVAEKADGLSGICVRISSFHRRFQLLSSWAALKRRGFDLLYDGSHL